MKAFTVTAPVEAAFVVIASPVEVLESFEVILLTVTPCEIVDQSVTTEALATAAVSPMIASPISNCAPPPPVPPLP